MNTPPAAPSATAATPSAAGVASPQERSGAGLMAFWLRLGGLRFCYFIAPFVLLYYFLTGGRARRGILTFYQRLAATNAAEEESTAQLTPAALTSPTQARHVRPTRWALYRQAFENYRFFAASLLDRMAAHAGHYSPELVMETPNKPRWLEGGLILVGAHMGDWTFCSRVFANLRQGSVHVVMDMSLSQKFQQQVAKLRRAKSGNADNAPQPAVHFIDASQGGLELVFAIKNALDANGIVCFLGDRPTHHSKSVGTEFLGANAAFPAGPFDLALRLRRPVLSFCCMKLKYSPKAPYHVWIQEVWDGEGRGKLENVLANYAKGLEKLVRIAPYNWFNFFDFWKQK